MGKIFMHTDNMLRNNSLSCFVFGRIFALMGLLVLLFSCQNTKDKAKSLLSGSEPKKLSLCISSDVSSLDPRYGVDATSSQIIKMLFEGLMYVDVKGHVAHAIAHSHKISSNKKIYTFHLRPCQWSNGMDITAYDFEYTWKSVICANQKYRSMAAHHFYIIKNVSKFLKSECSLDEVGIRALDARTFQVELEEAVPYFLESITNTWFFPICKFTDQTNGHWARESGKGFVCSGPFHLKRHRHNNEIFMEKNPLFWDAENVALHRVSVSVVKDTMTRLCLFEKGRINWVGRPLSGLPLDACAILKKENKITLSPSLGLYWYFFNTERFPFTNKKMRQAFSYALNRGEITDYILQAGEEPATTVLPSAYGLTESAFKDNNKEKAKELFASALSELGIKKENLPELTISYNTDETHQNVAQAIQHQLYSVLGVKVKLRHTEWKVHYSNLMQGDYCIGGMMWHSWVRDPIYILQTFRSKDDGINLSRWQNDQYQKTLAASDRETNETQRRKLLAVAQSILMEEMPVMPIYFTSTAYGKSENLRNVNVLESSMLDVRHAYFEERSSR